jgi:hypothetical protein
LERKSGTWPSPQRSLSSSTSTKSSRTAKVTSHMAELCVTSKKGRRTSITQDSQWVAISSTTQVTAELRHQSPNSLDSTEQHHFDAKLKVHDNRYQGFLLEPPLERYKYFRMKLDLFPKDVIDVYNLCNKVDTNGNVHCKVRRGM